MAIVWLRVLICVPVLISLLAWLTNRIAFWKSRQRVTLRLRTVTQVPLTDYSDPWAKEPQITSSSPSDNPVSVCEEKDAETLSKVKVVLVLPCCDCDCCGPHGSDGFGGPHGSDHDDRG